MTPIYSSAALKTRQREIKDVARSQVVHITENGNATAFVLMSEEVYKRKNLREAAERASYEARVASVVERGRADIEAGRFVEGTAAALAEIEQQAALRG